MITEGELARLRRQMQRRIRMALALRRVDAPTGVGPPGRPEPADPPAGGSGEPPPQH